MDSVVIIQIFMGFACLMFKLCIYYHTLC